MALQGVLAKDRDTGLYFDDQVRARRIITIWLEAVMSQGALAPKLNTLARKHGFTGSKLRKVMAADKDLREEILSQQDGELQLLLVKAVARGTGVVEDPAADEKEVRQWAEFAARYLGGGFTKGGPGGQTVFLNYITGMSLPAGFKRARARVLTEEEANERLGDVILPDG